MAMQRVTRNILEAALAGFRLEKQRIEDRMAEVQAMLDGTADGRGAEGALGKD